MDISDLSPEKFLFAPLPFKPPTPRLAPKVQKPQINLLLLCFKSYTWNMYPGPERASGDRAGR